MVQDFITELSRQSQQVGKAVFSFSKESDWETVPNTLPGTADASVVAVSTVINATSSRRAITLGGGTSLLLRLAYPKNCATITDPVVMVVGQDKAGNYGKVFHGAETLTTAVTTATATDLNTGVVKLTDVSKYTIYDMQGYSKAYVFVSTSMAATTAATEVANAYFQYKVV